MGAAERFGSRVHSVAKDDASVELTYVFTDSDDDLVLLPALEALAPPTYAGMKRDSLHLEQGGPGVWYGRANYSHDPRENVRGWDTSGGTIHIEHAPVVDSIAASLSTS